MHYDEERSERRKVLFFLVLEEPKQERKRKGCYGERKKIEISSHLFPRKKEFIFLSLVFSFGE
jgi:hypothetical protein